MKDSFNENFYILTGTAIPVLYVALIVQFPLIDTLTLRFSQRIDDLRSPSEKVDDDHVLRPRLRRVRLASLALGMFVAVFTGLTILITSLAGEINSILALYHQSDNPLVRVGTLRAVIALLVATLLVPTWTVFVAYIRINVHVVTPDEMRESLRKWWRKLWWEVPSASPPSDQLPTSGEL